MLVIAARPVELDAHLERLRTSIEALYGSALPAEARASVIEAAREIEQGKLRLTAVPSSGELALDVAASEIDAGNIFPAADRAAALRSTIVAGGLGEHKWADRRLLDRAAAAAPGGELPLLLDADGTVLEASRASVFAIRAEQLVSPPDDGRILPSIARRQAIEVATAEGIETTEERLTVADLVSGEVFLTGSVRGVEPVRTLDGAELAPPGEISERVADALRDRWLRVPAGAPVAAAAAGQRAGRLGR